VWCPAFAFTRFIRGWIAFLEAGERNGKGHAQPTGCGSQPQTNRMNAEGKRSGRLRARPAPLRPHPLGIVRQPGAKVVLMKVVITMV
jgi:hypothetical protein